jgi:hypothetical protein
MQTSAPPPVEPTGPADHDLDHGTIRTAVRPATARVLVAGFVLLIFGVPAGQLAWELAHSEPPGVLRVFQSAPTHASLRQYEEGLENASIPRKYVQPRLQLALSGALGFGSHKVVVGRDGWLFYTPGLDYLTGPGFLSGEHLHLRRKRMLEEGAADSEPDPRPAILELHSRCRERGIRLVLLPVPDKAQLQPAQVTRYARFTGPVAPPNNPDYQRFVAELRHHGVEVLDVLPPRVDPGAQLFLAQDTHWTPEWMDRVARQTADDLRPRLGPVGSHSLAMRPERVARHGDLVDMLRLPPDQKLFDPQAVTVERIVDAHTGRPWRPSADADVLVLGDSFCNIYSSEQMGWGNSAGFVEHLAYHLGRPLDRLVRNDAGAHATREMLSRELRRGNDRLSGKKVVVWEFAARELACGDWKAVPLAPGHKKKQREFYTPAADQAVDIQGVIRAVSPAPRPGTVPYKDHILTIHLAEIESGDDAAAAGKEAVVFTWSMRDNKSTTAAGYRPGDRVRVRLRPWSRVEQKYEAINRSALDDDDLQLVDPAWAEDATAGR